VPFIATIVTNEQLYAHKLMSATTHAVKNAAAALKKAADPWNKEGRETADRIASAAISMVIVDLQPFTKDPGVLTPSFADRYPFS
jgi:hypothetical protein